MVDGNYICTMCMTYIYTFMSLNDRFKKHLSECAELLTVLVLLIWLCMMMIIFLNVIECIVAHYEYNNGAE